MSEQPAKIRSASLDDYPLLLPLLKSLYHGDIGVDFKRIFEEFVSSEDCIVLLAEHANRILGVLIGSFHLDIDWEGKIAKIDALIIDRAHRRKGIGGKLVHHFITIAKENNCKAVKSRVNKKNTAAQKFHENMGFTRANTYEYSLDLNALHEYE